MNHHRMMVLAGCAALALAGPARSQTLCTTVNGPCSSETTSLLEYALQGYQYVRQGLQYLTEVQTTEQEIINTLKLPDALFQDATADIQNIVNIAKQADLLANGNALFIGNLSAGYYPLPVSGIKQIIAEQNDVGNAIKTLGQVLDAQLPKLTAATTTLNALQGEALGNAGRQQTLQDHAQIQAVYGQQQQALQAIHAATAQAQHAVMLANADREAMQAAWNDQMATAYTPANLDSAPSY